MATSSRRAPEPSRPKHVLALFGPTASGKTAVAGILRERLGAEVISADSAALYEGIPVITAAPHYPVRLVGVVPLTEDVSVGRYQRLAHEEIDTADVPLVVGGTGLYFRAALSSLALPPSVGGRRAHWQAEVERLGPSAAHATLAERDPAAAARVHPNDRKRLVRALELAEAGTSLAPQTDRLWTADTRHPTTIVALDLPLEELDRRIVERTRAMVAAGARDEARRAWRLPPSATARKVLGLQEFATLAEEAAVEAVTQRTRRLARYQRKWMRRMAGVVTLDANRPAEEIVADILALGRAGERLPGRA
ncbi:MAG TPA: tRNA (adenosine(37)-N6)-dimethylallyltransferase MiaA [Gaiellaceae bacterium]|nr:tRNA (adenosine(37)-N6)-dimethylallyltransferase MiaA [Gaiellaceae bacterium]